MECESPLSVGLKLGPQIVNLKHQIWTQGHDMFDDEHRGVGGGGEVAK